MASTLNFALESNAFRDLKFFYAFAFLFLLLLLLWRGWGLVWSNSTRLRGPPSESWIFGVSRKLFEMDDSALLLEAWAEKYGPVFRIPVALGSSRVIICDPKAAAHFYARESTGFRMLSVSKIFIEKLVCLPTTKRHCWTLTLWILVWAWTSSL